MSAASVWHFHKSILAKYSRKTDFRRYDKVNKKKTNNSLENNHLNLV